MESVLERKKDLSGAVYESGPENGLRTIMDIVLYRADKEPDKEAFTYILDGDNETASWTYQELRNAVTATAAKIQKTTKPGDRVILLFEPGLPFIAAYLATVSSGAVAVPCHPPMGGRQVKRLLDMIQNCQPSLILYSDLIANTAPQLKQFMGMADGFGISVQSVDIRSDESPSDWLKPLIRPDDLAMLQYTSASTGDPKGVMVTQENLVKNCEAIYKWLGNHPQRKGCIWLPPYHDMGLLGGIMQPLYAGFPLVFMSPMHFVQKPFRWIKALSDYRLTTTGAPNFAFQLCVDEISDDELDANDIDLSCVREIFSGSEPINPGTMAAFYQRFKHYGLPATAINPCYGLAEATLFVSGKAADNVVKTTAFDTDKLDAGRAEVSQGETFVRNIVSCGVAGNELDIRIVDPDSLIPVADGSVGEIWISGPSVTLGYWRNDDLTAQAFNNRLPGEEGSYYRTGDLGFFSDGELYVTGRIKEVIIVRGRNLYPQDIERCALSISPDFSIAAAFSVPGTDTEGLGIAIAARENPGTEAIQLLTEKVSAAVAGEFNVTPSVVHIGPRKTIPRTTSGKIQRGVCRDYYLKDKLLSFGQGGSV